MLLVAEDADVAIVLDSFLRVLYAQQASTSFRRFVV